MDETNRYITKICRAAKRYARLYLKEFDLGTGEYECLHYIRKNSGISQEELRAILNSDKAAITRMVANLERKGYLIRKQSEKDKRVKNLFPTDKVRSLKQSTSSAESFFYEWLLEDIDKDEKKVFLKVLDKLYVKSKNERVVKFENIKKRERK